MTIQVKPRFCPHCDSRDIIKKGTRKNQYRLIQLYFCKSCLKYFTETDIQRVKYPPKVILQSISLYNLGYTQDEVCRLIAKKHRLHIPRRTISEWLGRYRPICSYSRLRAKGKELYYPEKIIEIHLFTHRQVYAFKVHRAKLDLLASELPPSFVFRLKEYLFRIPTDKFPHHIFEPKEEEQETRLPRSSQTRFETLPFVKLEKQNRANDLAALGLVLAKRTIDRHPCIQEFMLVNDSTTVACEVPVYLTHDDILYFNRKGFTVPLQNQSTPITGHIDFVQIRNGLIHILDYKPDANKINPVSQLTIYALGLASRTKLPLKTFKCAWFDDKHYFEFFPLHAVYPRKAYHPHLAKNTTNS